MNTQKQIVVMVAMLFLFMGGCAAYTAVDLPIRAEDQTDWTRDQSLERGALLFANNCRTCHGNKGQGSVGPQILANSTTMFQEQDPLLLKANRDLLRRTLQCGRANTLMPAWLNTNGGALNAIQIEHLVDFLTAPVTQDADGNVTSEWWDEAEHFAQNLNAPVAVLVGGDSLETLAKAHNIGPKELAAYNNLPVEGILKQGSKIKIPPFRADENGYTYNVYKDNETITKIADAHFVGAVILADLNGFGYSLKEKRGVATFHLLDDQGRLLAGLFPGVSKLKFPPGSTYTITAGDTIDSIAEAHGLTTSAIVSLNRDLLGNVATDADLDFEQRLKLPKSVAIVQTGQTLAAIAKLHDITVDDLAAANSIAADASPPVGSALTLPLTALYVVQAGDTWESIGQAHASDASGIAQANGRAVTDPLSPDVILLMPQINAYTVQGQDLAAIAQGYAGVTADSLADANGIKADTILAVNTQLKLPETAFGSAPGDARNPGTACVQYAVSKGAFDIISGNTSEVTKPTTVSNEVKIAANANDWTVTADGTAQPANKGAALVKAGSTITFSSVTGLHNITINGATEKPDLKQGDTRQITFKDAGDFKITCTYHPDMLANLFVE